MSLEIQNLSVHLKGSAVLEDLDFNVPQAAFFCVIGPNGAGKTIFTRTLLGSLLPTRGSVKVLGSAAAVRSDNSVGYVPQLKSFDRSFPALAEEFVASGIDRRWPWCRSKSRSQMLESALKRVNALHLSRRSLSTLSGGELQRIYLARAFVAPRRLLILDEPSTGIDAVGESDLYSLLEDFRAQSNCTIMMVTHDLDVARHHATHVLVLNRKQLGFGGPELADRSDIIERAFGHAGHSHD